MNNTMVSPAVWESNLGTMVGASFFFTLLIRGLLTPRGPHAQSPRNSLPAFSPLCNGPQPDLHSFHMWSIAKASWIIFLPPVWLRHWSIFHIPDGDSFRSGKFYYVISLPPPTFRMKSNSLAKHIKPFGSISSAWSTIPHLRPYSLPYHTRIPRNIPGSFISPGLWMCTFTCKGVPWLPSAPNSCFLAKLPRLFAPLALLVHLALPECDGCLITKDPLAQCLPLLVHWLHCFIMNYFRLSCLPTTGHTIHIGGFVNFLRLMRHRWNQVLSLTTIAVLLPCTTYGVRQAVGSCFLKKGRKKKGKEGGRMAAASLPLSPNRAPHILPLAAVMS